MIAAMDGHLPVVEYLQERGADVEASDNVSDVISLRWNHTYVTRESMYVWMYQPGYTPLMIAAREGHLPMVEYLVERAADMTVKNEVSDVI